MSSTVDEPSIISRTVSAVLSRGTLIDPAISNDSDFSFCAFVYFNGDVMEMCLADISLGIYDIKCLPFDVQTCSSLFMKFRPKELIISREHKDRFSDIIRKFSGIQVTAKVFDSANDSREIMMCYYEDMMLGDLKRNLRRVDIFDDSNGTINLNGALLESLDIFSPNSKKKTLWRELNRTITASGRRKLLKWLIAPSSNLHVIQKRQLYVKMLFNENSFLGTSYIPDFRISLPVFEIYTGH